MPIQPTVGRLSTLIVCLCAGCALTPDGQKSADALSSGQSASVETAASPAASPQATPAQNDMARQGQAVAPNPSSTAVTQKAPPTAAPDPHVIDDVLAELASLGQIQPEAQKRLIEDLRKTDPAYWPMLVQTFRATLAYRRRNAEMLPEAPSTAEPASTEAAPSEIMQVTAVEPVRQAVNAPPREPERATTQANAAAAPQAVPSANAIAAPSVPVPADAAKTKAPSAGDWRQHLDAAITELQRQTNDRPADADSLANHVYLRLLDLAAGRRDDALKPIAGLPPAQQDYWSKQLFALSTYLDRNSSDPTRRATEAGIHLSRAVAALGEQGQLLVRNLAFCTDVHSYGVLKRFEPAEFHAGQKVLVYAEIENFKSEETAQGFHTSLEASYQILDRQGQRVAHDDLALTEEHCQNRRRDFFVRYFIDLPKNIYEGSYALELTIEDQLGRKIGQSSIDFIVKQK